MDRDEKNLLTFQVVTGIIPLILGLLQFHSEVQVISDIRSLMQTSPHDVADEFGVAAFSLFLAGMILGSAMDGYMRWRVDHPRRDEK